MQLKEVIFVLSDGCNSHPVIKALLNRCRLPYVRQIAEVKLEQVSCLCVIGSDRVDAEVDYKAQHSLLDVVYIHDVLRVGGDIQREYWERSLVGRVVNYINASTPHLIPATPDLLYEAALTTVGVEALRGDVVLVDKVGIQNYAYNSIYGVGRTSWRENDLAMREIGQVRELLDKVGKVVIGGVSIVDLRGVVNHGIADIRPEALRYIPAIEAIPTIIGYGERGELYSGVTSAEADIINEIHFELENRLRPGTTLH